MSLVSCFLECFVLFGRGWFHLHGMGLAKRPRLHWLLAFVVVVVVRGKHTYGMHFGLESPELFDGNEPAAGHGGTQTVWYKTNRRYN